MSGVLFEVGEEGKDLPGALGAEGAPQGLDQGVGEKTVPVPPAALIEGPEKWDLDAFPVVRHR